MEKDSVYYLLSIHIRELLKKANLSLERLQEIRLRIGKPILLRYDNQEYALTEAGTICREAENGYCISARELEETLECVSGYSMYAFDEELKQGFLTVPGGHRIGVTGRIVMDGKRVSTIRNISCINIRLSHQVPGCADTVLPYLIRDGEVCHSLIISPPGCGKTTLLRDIVRQLSNGTIYLSGRTVGVVDERSEIAGSYLGIPQNDIGIRTDILDGCSKTEGMMMLLRSMSPQVIAVDEIGNHEERDALEAVFHCGCKLIATIHGSSVDDIRRNPMLHRMIQQHQFERYIVLGAVPAGGIQRIFDDRGSILWQCI